MLERMSTYSSEDGIRLALALTLTLALGLRNVMGISSLGFLVSLALGLLVSLALGLLVSLALGLRNLVGIFSLIDDLCIILCILCILCKILVLEVGGIILVLDYDMVKVDIILGSFLGRLGSFGI